MRVAFVLNKYGDLGNRLFRFARLHHETSRLGIILVDLSFYQYVWNFKPEIIFYRIIFFIQKLMGVWIYNQFQKLAIRESQNKNSWITKIKIPDFTNIDEIRNIISKISCPILLIECGEIRCEGETIKENARIQLGKIFTIHPRFLKKAREILGSDRNLCSVVGVHIRHGDYREYGNGAFFFDTQKYVDSIKNLKETHKGEKNLRFAIVCDEKTDTSLFEGLDVVFGLIDNPIVDLAILQNCNYIISTFSSFSAWPSLVNKIPRIIVHPNSCASWDKAHLSNLNFWDAQ